MACSKINFNFSIFHVWFCTPFCSRDQHILSILNIYCYTKLLTPAKMLALLFTVFRFFPSKSIPLALTRCWCVPFHFVPSCLLWPSKWDFYDKAALCFNSFLIRTVTNVLHVWTFEEVSLKHSVINPSSFKVITDSMRVLYIAFPINTSRTFLSQSIARVPLQCIPVFLFSKGSQNAEHTIISGSVMSKTTMTTTQSILVYKWSWSRQMNGG